MKNHGSLGPTCVLKVNLQRCKACALKVLENLKQINGAKSIHIDTKEGVVTVRGVAYASTLIKAIEKVGKKAELCKFEMQPRHEDETETPCCSKGKSKNRKHAHDDDDGNLGSKMHIPHNTNGVPAGFFAGPGPALARPYEGLPPMLYRNYRNGNPPPRAYYYVPLPHHQPPPPPPSPHHHDAPLGTTIVHTFNDFNPHACIVL